MDWLTWISYQFSFIGWHWLVDKSLVIRCKDRVRPIFAEHIDHIRWIKQFDKLVNLAYVASYCREIVCHCGASEDSHYKQQQLHNSGMTGLIRSDLASGGTASEHFGIWNSNLWLCFNWLLFRIPKAPDGDVHDYLNKLVFSVVFGVVI